MKSFGASAKTSETKKVCHEPGLHALKFKPIGFLFSLLCKPWFFLQPCHDPIKFNCPLLSNFQTDSHHMHNYPQPPNVTILNQPSHQEWSNREPTSWVNRLKYSHDNMDSEYYVNNRLLFDLYVERISRTGQSPANPY